MEGVPGGERQTDISLCVCVCGCGRRWWCCSSTSMCSGGYAGPPHSGTSSFPTRERHQNWMKILIIQRQISPRKQVFWNDKAKINAASPLSVSLPISSCMRGGERKRGWRGSAYVAVCLFVLRPMCGSFCWCASVCVLAGWTSASCPAACAVTQWIPWRQERCFSLATSRLGQRRGDAAWREAQTSTGLEDKQAHMHKHM